MKTFIAACVCLCALQSAAVADDFVSTGSLLTEMVDLVRLGDFPEPAYKTVQYSSYDRRSVSPNTPGWYANSDGFGREPIPGFLKVLKEPDANGVGEYLMVNMDGPGAIVRTWTARINGDVRAYLDQSEKPVFDGSANTFFLDKYGYYAAEIGLSAPETGDSFHQRDADYFPIPFSKGCRIVWKGKLNELHFYHIQIREYAPGTAVKTFQPQDGRTYAKEVQRAISILQNPSAAVKGIAVKERTPLDLNLQPGENVPAVKSDNGPAVVRQFTLKMEAKDLGRALRQTVLRIWFDRHPFPQVESPVGDFFGAGPGVNPYDSLPITVKTDGTMICRYVMPFARSLSVSFENYGDQPVKVTGEVLISPFTWRPERSMHFRARWRVNHDLLARGGDNAFDLPFLVAQGQGVYVGTAVMIMNPSPVPTAYGNWWGEGDEKVFVDGEDFPSTFGTGSEDYFNYSWSNCDLFDHPYCVQPLVTGPDTRGYISNIRWHILDALPFNQEIAFYMELFSHRETAELSYARIAYHYARPGIRDDSVPLMRSDARIAPLPKAWEPEATHGCRGAVFFQAEQLTHQGDGKVQAVDGELWSGGKLLLWQPPKKGSKLSLSLEVTRAGRYAIVMTAALTPTSGAFQARCDGKPLTRGGNQTAVDLHSPYQTMLRNIIWDPVDLSAGKHVIELEALGDDPSHSAIGADFMWLLPR